MEEFNTWLKKEINEEFDRMQKISKENGCDIYSVVFANEKGDRIMVTTTDPVAFEKYIKFTDGEASG